MDITTGQEFTREAWGYIQRAGYSHILHTVPRTPTDKSENNHWLEALKEGDERIVENAEGLYGINDYEVADMADGEIGISFKILLP